MNQKKTEKREKTCSSKFMKFKFIVLNNSTCINNKNQLRPLSNTTTVTMFSPAI